MRFCATLLLSLLYISSAFAQIDTTQKIIPGRKNSKAQQKKSYVILISADGFRYDYARKYHADHLLTLSNHGVKAPYMLPAFPSTTFPNHYTLITGLYPSHTGLVANTFYDANTKSSFYYKSKNGTLDSAWYNGGTPLWVLAEQQHMLSATHYWVGSEAPIKGVYPTYSYPYNEKIGIHDRIQTIVNWLKLPPAQRPHFITFYLPQVDHEGHKYGPDSPEEERSVKFIDSAVYELTKAVKTTGLKVNFIFVSDHGMIKADTAHPIPLPKTIDTSKFIISGDALLVELYAKNPTDIQSTYTGLQKEASPDYSPYLKTNVPPKLHYGAKDDHFYRIGDILLSAKAPKVFNLYGTHSSIGVHGYDATTVKEMRATFYAWGPAFKHNLTIQPFENVEVFPLIARILGLKYAPHIDGTGALPQRVLLKTIAK